MKKKLIALAVAVVMTFGISVAISKDTKTLASSGTTVAEEVIVVPSSIIDPPDW
jgi:hypothetical protein